MNRARTTRYASDDHADDLLADILDTTAESARVEQAERERQLAAKRETEERSRLEAEAARIARHQEKLEAELQRQSQLAERRTQRLAALRVEATQAPVPVPVAPAFDEGALRREIAAQMRDEMREEMRTLVATPMPDPASTVEDLAPRAPVTNLFVGGLIVVVTLVAGAAALLMQTSYRPDPNPYAKAVFAPLDREAVAVEIATLPIPVAEVVAPASIPDAPRPRAKTLRVKAPEKKPTTAFGAPTTKSKERKSWEELNDALNGGGKDPFGVVD